jgi:hypothetical protein
VCGGILVKDIDIRQGYPLAALMLVSEVIAPAHVFPKFSERQKMPAKIMSYSKSLFEDNMF